MRAESVVKEVEATVVSHFEKFWPGKTRAYISNGDSPYFGAATAAQVALTARVTGSAEPVRPVGRSGGATASSAPAAWGAEQAGHEEDSREDWEYRESALLLH